MGTGSRGDRWDARLYDERHSFVWREAAPLLELLAPKPGERVLDLGCGTGHLTAQVAAAGVEVIGIDRSPAMVEQARRAYPHLRFDVADARDFSFEQPFDAVLSNAVLHWIPEQDRVAGGVYRALKPGGRFVVEFGGRGDVEVIMRAIRAAAEAVGAGRWESPWYFPGIPDYTTLLERAGLEVTFAALIDRPTPLEGEEGLRNWVTMFAGDLISRLPDGKREDFFRHVEESARPALYHDGRWFADYRRLRVVAHRPRG